MLALRDFYANSWRLVARQRRARRGPRGKHPRDALALPVAVVVLRRGPCGRRIVHCSVTLVRTGDLALVDAWEGLRLHWRRGLASPSSAAR